MLKSKPDDFSSILYKFQPLKNICGNIDFDSLICILAKNYFRVLCFQKDKWINWHKYTVILFEVNFLARK